MGEATATKYQLRILPALNRIQHRRGSLDKAELTRFAAESQIPLYRLQEVASFFPHFRLTPPAKKVTLRVCGDMACHLAGSAKVVEQLSAFADNDVGVETVSCLGRCDRAPATCVFMRDVAAQESGESAESHESSAERYYLGRSPSLLENIVAACVAGTPPPPDSDAALPSRWIEWTADPYKPGEASYAAVIKAVGARDEALKKASQFLQSSRKWTPERAEEFRDAVRARANAEEIEERQLAAAVRAWQTEDDWAKGPELAGWSDAILGEFDEKHADLRGLGGAGVPASLKWGDVRDAVRNARRRREDDRAFIVVNADESEPGTFKDRELLLRTPHLVIEGAILAGVVTDATEAFIYIRHEYAEQIQACENEILRAEEMGLCGPNARILGRPFPVSVFVSPGGYICGEQSALIEAMSDRRAEPRNLPPKLETNGLDDQPTLVSNVETFAWAPYIWIHGGAEYAALGANGWKGRRFFSVSGDVKRPGVYEVPMGMTLRELICGDQYCGGIKDGQQLKAIAPSGPSGGFLPRKLLPGKGLPKNLSTNRAWPEFAKRRGLKPDAEELDILDLELELNLFRSLSPTQALGAGIVVYAQNRDMAEQAVNALRFFRNESCGKCVPCRIGSQKLANLGANLLEGRIKADRWSQELWPIVNELSDAMTLTSICGLGRSVPMPLRTLVEFFDEDLARYLEA